MLEKVLKAINQYKMFETEKNVTVALSGGADSVTLLYCLLEIKEQFSLEISAAHLNHNLRGEESLRDENFVRELCEKLGVPLYVESADITSVCAKTKESTELAARRVRYEFLSRVSKGLVATAHNADDNIETVLFNLTRGAALTGLCGIPVVRDNFIRPLIFCSRSEIEDYCQEKGISFVNDSTNFTDDYTRNKIRHNVVPVLKEINSNLEDTTGKMVQFLRADNDFLTAEANKAFYECKTESGLDSGKLLSYHKAIVLRVLKMFYEQSYSGELTSVHLEKMYDALLGKAAILPGKIKALTKNGNFVLKNDEKMPDISFNTDILRLKRENVNNLLLKNAVDCDKIVGGVKVGIKNPGDKMRPAGRGVTKTLKQLFTEKKIPLEFRKNLPVASDNEGIIWVYGIGADERVKINASTKECFVFNVDVWGNGNVNGK